jgi:c-di-GMP-binding flagellar brake protein YcgR
MKSEIPEKFQNSERRHFIRHPLCFPLEYKIITKAAKKADKELKADTINVSRGGLLFSAKKPVDVDAVICVKMPFRDKIFKVRAKVVHCQKNLETKLYNIGVCFHRFGDAFKIKLIEQMYLILEYRDLRSLQLGREMSLQTASKEWIKRYSERFKRLYW